MANTSTTSDFPTSTTTPFTTTTFSFTTTPFTTTPFTTTTTPSSTTTSTTISTTTTTPSTTSTTVPVVSSTIYVTPTTASVAIVTVISTQTPITVTPSNTVPVSTASSSSPSATVLGTNGTPNSSSSGLSTSGKIAIAVIIPIVVIALLLVLGLFLWKKRKQRQTAEDERKDAMVEYGFNPNNDPNLVPVGAAYTDQVSDGDDGYRGWGTTSSNARKPSTTLGSNSRAPNGMAYSDTTSQPGNTGYATSPNGHPTEHWSGDHLAGGRSEGIDGIGALGAATAGGTAAAMMSRNNRTSQAGVQRGPSNASSSYSHNPPHSEASSDTPGAAMNYYQEEVPYNIYNDVAPSHGPYGDGTYGAPGGDQPVIRDVQARRNTKIERVPTFPQTQGGISQNF